MMITEQKLDRDLSLDLWSTALRLQYLPASMALKSGHQTLPGSIELQQWLDTLDAARALVQELIDLHGGDNAPDQ